MKQLKSRIIVYIITAVLLISGVVVLLIRRSNTPEPPPPQNGTPQAGQHAPGQMHEDGILEFSGPGDKALASISIEIAETDQSREQGLMGRTRIGEKQGMLFIFPEEEERSFWMANTPLPLDIIFINAKKQIVSIQRHTKPYSKESLPSYEPAQYVVEVNAGFCDKFGVSAGNTVSWIRK